MSEEDRATGMYFLCPQMHIGGHRPLVRFLNKHAPAERTFCYQAFKGACTAATAI